MQATFLREMCPVCHQPMLAYQFHGVEIDRCPECAGTWLDSGEFETMLDLAGIGAGEMSRALARAAGRRHGRRRCPRCHARLREVAVGGVPAVIIDRCRRGHGFWFDRGEMEAVVERCADGDEGAVARFFAGLYHHEYGDTA